MVERYNAEVLTFDSMFLIFFLGSILGVIIEGVFCLVTKKQWEAHVLTVWGWFNILYGAGAVLFYIGAAKMNMQSVAAKVALMTVGATLLELLGGLLLKNYLGMKAWDYSDQFLNFRGLICPLFSLAWAVPALVMCLSSEKMTSMFRNIESARLHVVLVLLGMLIALDIIVTAACIMRWSRRHYEVPAATRIGQTIDRLATDEWMSTRFMEWSFLD